VTMGKGLVFDRVSGGGITTQLEFSRANGRLGNHVILRGRGAGERIDRIHSIAGRSLGGPAAAAPLMTFSATAREAETAADLEDEDAASRQEAALAGAFSTPVRGRAQALALPFGDGRVVVLGAATLVAGSSAGGGESTVGIRAAGTDNRQFALNVLHWLSHLLN
jgi:hypothetical protein